MILPQKSITETGDKLKCVGHLDAGVCVQGFSKADRVRRDQSSRQLQPPAPSDRLFLAARVGYGVENERLSEITAVTFDRTLLREGGTIALSYGQDKQGRVNLPEKLKLSDAPSATNHFVSKFRSGADPPFQSGFQCRQETHFG